MSYFQRPADTLEEQQADQHEQPRAPGSRLADFGDRIARAFASLDRGRVDQLGPGQAEDGDPYDVIAEVPGAAHDSRFPIGPLGYSRAAVEERVAELEREISELREAGESREVQAPMTISEELERLGEQTASILVVAHDQAHETTRLAHEQAERCVSDAATNAVAITEQAKRRLHELDNETDAVWRERARLVEDARGVGAALIALSEEAAERFPAADPQFTQAISRVPEAEAEISEPGEPLPEAVGQTVEAPVYFPEDDDQGHTAD
jgi:cell division septum initiation protein DivIVA